MVLLLVVLLFMSCFIVAKAYTGAVLRSTISVQIFFETSFMPIAWTFEVGMQTAESKDRANLNLARFVLRFSEGGVGGGALPLPPPRKSCPRDFP